MSNSAATRLASILAAVLSLLGCRVETASHPADRAREQSGQKVVLFAAASTANALDEICEQFGREYNVTVDTNYAGSSALAQQIENGAAAHVFVSANEKWADYLEKKNLVAKRQELVGNRLVVIVPADSTIEVKSLDDLLDARIRHLALADPEAVPAGVYAKGALTKLGLWQRLKPKVVAGADVRHTLSYVETGAAEAGVVYATDAAISDAVRVVLRFDPDLTGPIRYPAVLLQEGAENAAAASLLEYLASPQAAKVFRKHGFTVLNDQAVAGQ